jgi:small subunit ribosomal protein S8
MAGMKTVSCPCSKIKVAICKVLEEEGYIGGHAIDDSDGKPVLNVELKYYRGKPVIEEIKRVSRPGLRYYRGKEELPKNRAGLGIAILSTNKGLMTDKQAQAAGIGGEVLCTVF